MSAARWPALVLLLIAAAWCVALSHATRPVREPHVTMRLD